MKKQTFRSASFMVVMFCFMHTFSYGQAPQAFNYQSIVRNTFGDPMVNKDIIVRATIHDGSANGTSVYQEIHDITTSQFGLINIEIGNGSMVNGVFSAINWAVNSKWIEIEADFGSGYIVMGTSQLLSVPYALNFAPGAAPEGKEGPEGPAGTDGVDGSDGPIGPIGATGNNGAAGTNGIDGDDGATGIN
jgi:hypothetical protein